MCGGTGYYAPTPGAEATPCPYCAPTAPTPKFTRTRILDTAAELTSDTRDKEYGSAAGNFKDIADLWSTYLGYTVVEADVAIMMTLLKVARLKRNPQHRDSWIDGCGYLALGGELSESGE
jgi:hypothetical protein